MTGSVKGGKKGLKTKMNGIDGMTKEEEMAG